MLSQKKKRAQARLPPRNMEQGEEEKLLCPLSGQVLRNALVELADVANNDARKTVARKCGGWDAICQVLCSERFDLYTRALAARAIGVSVTSSSKCMKLVAPNLDAVTTALVETAAASLSAGESTYGHVISLNCNGTLSALMNNGKVTETWATSRFTLDSDLLTMPADPEAAARADVRFRFVCSRSAWLLHSPSQ